MLAQRMMLMLVMCVCMRVFVCATTFMQGVTPNTDMIIMDQGTSGAKKVARALTSQGFKNAYVLDGGFRRWQGTPALAIQPAPEADEQRRASQDNVQQTQSLPVLSTGRR